MNTHRQQQPSPQLALLPFEVADDALLLLIGHDAPPVAEDTLKLIPYGIFLAELDKLVGEGYEFDAMPFIDFETFPSVEKLAERSSERLEAERRLIAFAASRSCLEFLRYNHFDKDGARATQMSEQSFELARLNTKIAAVLAETRQRERLARFKIELPPPFNVKLSDIEAVTGSVSQ